MQASPGTLRKLVHLRVDLEREFPQVPAEHLDEHLEDVASDLLARAHFEEFVPLLVHRHVRSRLVAELHRSQPSPTPSPAKPDAERSRALGPVLADVS